MTILFAGGENSEVGIINGSTTTTSGKFRSTYARGAVRAAVSNGVLHNFSGALSDYIAAQTTACDFWYGFQFAGAGGASTNHQCVEFSNGGVGFLRIFNPNGTAAGTANLQTSTNGSSWTDYPSSNVSQSISSPVEWTFRIKRHATLGCFQWWIAGTLWYEVTGDTTGYFTTCTRVAWGSAGGNQDSGVSEIVATSSDDPRVGMNCATLYYTGDGNDTDWAGTYTDVAELSEDTATVLTSTAAGEESSFLHTDVPALTAGVVVRAVIVSGKWRTAVGAPQNLSGYLRISGTNYDDADDPVQAVAAVAALLQFIWHLSPATGLAFTEAEVNALEPGMVSVA
jgi:hypothetical protein